MSFFYQKGKVTTTIPWQRPTPDNAIKFLDNLLPKIHSQGLELTIIGGSLEDMTKTWDLDMILTGTTKDQDLEDLLHEMTDFSLNQCSLLIDAYWISDSVFHELDENNIWRYKKDVYYKILNPTIKRSPTSNLYVDILRRLDRGPLTEYLCQATFPGPIPDKYYPKIEKNNGLKTMLAVDWRKELIDKQSKIKSRL
jgi:hypothetical protein